MGKDIQDYLDNGIYGTPKIKPEEQKKFLGTFRERVVCVLSIQELETFYYQPFIDNKIQQYPNGILLTNAANKPTIQNTIIQIAKQHNLEFKVVDTDHSALNPNDLGLVYTLDYAINAEDIYFSPINSHQSEQTEAKKTLKKNWSRFFKF